MRTGAFINKVAASKIIAFDLINFRPTIEIIGFDIRALLFMGMIIREKEFREAIDKIDFTLFRDKAVAVHCSAEAIIPSWTYMVLADRLSGNAVYFDFKDIPSLELDLWKANVQEAELSSFAHQKVVVRARPEIPPTLYMLATERLKTVVKTLMYGEIGMPKVIFK